MSSGESHGLAAYCDGCRCETCVAVNRKYHVEWRRAKRTELVSVDGRAFLPNLKKHGLTGYNYGCRCGPCTVAKSKYLAEQQRVKRQRSGV